MTYTIWFLLLAMALIALHVFIAWVADLKPRGRPFRCDMGHWHETQEQANSCRGKLHARILGEHFDEPNDPPKGKS